MQLSYVWHNSWSFSWSNLKSRNQPSPECNDRSDKLKCQTFFPAVFIGRVKPVDPATPTTLRPFPPFRSLPLTRRQSLWLEERGRERETKDNNFRSVQSWNSQQSLKRGWRAVGGVLYSEILFFFFNSSRRSDTSRRDVPARTEGGKKIKKKRQRRTHLLRSSESWVTLPVWPPRLTGCCVAERWWWWKGGGGGGGEPLPQVQRLSPVQTK